MSFDVREGAKNRAPSDAGAAHRPPPTPAPGAGAPFLPPPRSPPRALLKRTLPPGSGPHSGACKIKPVLTKMPGLTADSGGERDPKVLAFEGPEGDCSLVHSSAGRGERQMRLRGLGVRAARVFAAVSCSPQTLRFNERLLRARHSVSGLGMCSCTSCSGQPFREDLTRNPTVGEN